MFANVVECSASNAFNLDKHAKPLEQTAKGRKKRDYLQIRIGLAEGFIGTFQGRKRAGRQRSAQSSSDTEQL